MSNENLVYFIILSLFAEIAGTIGGFGSSIFFVPLAGLFLDFHSVLGISAVFHLSSNISKIIFFRKGFNLRLVLTIGIPAVLFAIAGGILAFYFNNKVLQVCLIVFLIVFSLVLFLFKKLSIKPTLFNSISGGALSGFAAGLVGTGGAIRGLTLAAFNLEKEVFIATSAVIDLGIDSSRSIVYFLNGFVHNHDLYLIPILLVVSFIGTYIGKKILFYFSSAQFKALTLVLIFYNGIFSLVKLLV